MTDKEEKKVPHNKYDRGYKYLLAFVDLLQQFIEGWVDQDWKNQLDFSRAEKINKEYILKDFREVESDVLYKIPLVDSNETVYLYTLIEHQSTVDHSMAFRVLMYLVSIWYDIYVNMEENERKREDFSLPPVFPIVLYNGEKKWDAATSVKELVQKGEIFQDFLPNVRYHLVDVSQQGVEKLKELSNSIAGVFLLEQENFAGANDWQEKFDTAIEWFDKEKNSELWKALFHWLAYHLANKISPKDSDRIIDDIDFENKPKQEIYTMIQALPNRIHEDGEKKGMIKMLSWTSPHLVEKYEKEILSAKNESELAIIKEKIKKELQS